MLIKESHTDVQITVDGKETSMSERAIFNQSEF